MKTKFDFESKIFNEVCIHNWHSLSKGVGVKWGSAYNYIMIIIGAMKQGQGMCSTFKASNLTYLNVLRS